MPSWKDLRRFCQNDGWEMYKDSKDYHYRKEDADGIIRKTKASKGTGEIYGHLWQEILKKQLNVTMEYFNKKKNKK